MVEQILVVDDDQAILDFTYQVLTHAGWRVVTMSDPLAALDYLGREEVAVLLTDNNMPVMRGLELIEKANSVASETVKIIMSAYTDLSVALRAINQCQVFKIVPKPWSAEEMLRTIGDALLRHRTLQKIRSENEDILRSLAQTIELKDHYTKGHCDRVATYAVAIAKGLDLSVDMQREIKYGSWLHDCGKIGVPERILNAARKLEPEEFAIIKNHPSWGADVASKANLSSVVVNIILCHHEHFGGGGYPQNLAGEEIPIEARIVSVADVFDAIASDRPYRQGLSLQESAALVVEMRGKELDPSLVDLFLEQLEIGAPHAPTSEGGPTMNRQAPDMTLRGDFSIEGVGEQWAALLKVLSESEANHGRADLAPPTIDLTQVETLDACGCQLLALFLRRLKDRGMAAPRLTLSQYCREQIHFLGFTDELLSGNRP